MPKITRFNGNLQAFASQQQVNERTLFGQTAIANDLTAQITAQFLRGWGIVGPSDQPSLQDFNAAMYTSTQLTAYLHQMGIPEFNTAQEYYLNSVTQVGGAIYISLQDGNTGRAPASNPTWWRSIAAVQATESAAGIARIASAALALAGANNTDMMTPLRTAQAFGQYGLGVQAGNAETNLNNYLTAGLWVTPLVATMSNLPPDISPSARAMVIVCGGSTYASQIIVSGASNVTYMAWRNCAGGVFSPWRTVAGTDSPALTGTPTSTTPPTADNSTRIATTAQVQAAAAAAAAYAIGNLIPTSSNNDTTMGRLAKNGDRQVCAAWVNFNGMGTVAIRQSFNVSSVADDGVGKYRVLFANPMADTNYSVVPSAALYDGFGQSITANEGLASQTSYSRATGGVPIFVVGPNGAYWDVFSIGVQVFGSRA